MKVLEAAMKASQMPQLGGWGRTTMKAEFPTETNKDAYDFIILLSLLLCFILMTLEIIFDIKNNPAALLALCWYWATDGVGSKDMVILPYKDSLLLFSRYLQQLVMESLGKEYDLDGNRVNQGISVYGNKGSTDQHAYIQQLREGVHNFFATFIEVLRDRPPGHDWELEPGVTSGDYLFGMLQGTRSALYSNDRESITVTVQEVTPRSVGALVALYERAVGIYASLVNINAYHQPGVEAGKKAAGEVLALQKRVLAVLNEARLDKKTMSFGHDGWLYSYSQVICMGNVITYATLLLCESVTLYEPQESAAGSICSFCNLFYYSLPFQKGSLRLVYARVDTVLFPLSIKDVTIGPNYILLVFIFSCKEPVEPLTIEEVAERCHAPEDIEVIYKIIAHMAANDRALIAEGSAADRVFAMCKLEDRDTAGRIAALLWCGTTVMIKFGIIALCGFSSPGSSLTDMGKANAGNLVVGIMQRQQATLTVVEGETCALLQANEGS
ncbi:hypothetical protein TSUD_217410 [Trifolium subterraneum]|uniref:Glucose-6-phosphate isomerase n=1 Tax=Trifolium subterraneum TaxID=3900 RepID=A0A2Z6MSR6_TRISU|nr:hypothetical protein TSUD_217410 [Trifolium subterraneum]